MLEREDVLRLMDEAIEHQRRKILAIARELVPGITEEDLRNPQDFPALMGNARFNFEEGILSGWIGARIALPGEFNRRIEKKTMERTSPAQMGGTRSLSCVPSAAGKIRSAGTGGARICRSHPVRRWIVRGLSSHTGAKSALKAISNCSRIPGRFAGVRRGDAHERGCFEGRIDGFAGNPHGLR